MHDQEFLRIEQRIALGSGALAVVGAHLFWALITFLIDFAWRGEITEQNVFATLWYGAPVLLLVRWLHWYVDDSAARAKEDGYEPGADAVRGLRAAGFHLLFLALAVGAGWIIAEIYVRYHLRMAFTVMDRHWAVAMLAADDLLIAVLCRAMFALVFSGFALQSEARIFGGRHKASDAAGDEAPASPRTAQDEGETPEDGAASSAYHGGGAGESSCAVYMDEPAAALVRLSSRIAGRCAGMGESLVARKSGMMPQDETDARSLGFAIARRREARGLTQAGLAEELGISRQSLGKWESGRVIPRGQNLMRLARALDCSVEDLLAPDDGKAVAEDVGSSGEDHATADDATGAAKVHDEDSSSAPHASALDSALMGLAFGIMALIGYGSAICFGAGLRGLSPEQLEQMALSACAVALVLVASAFALGWGFSRLCFIGAPADCPRDRSSHEAFRIELSIALVVVLVIAAAVVFNTVPSTYALIGTATLAGVALATALIPIQWGLQLYEAWAYPHGRPAPEPDGRPSTCAPLDMVADIVAWCRRAKRILHERAHATGGEESLPGTGTPLDLGADMVAGWRRTMAAFRARDRG